MAGEHAAVSGGPKRRPSARAFRAVQDHVPVERPATDTSAEPASAELTACARSAHRGQRLRAAHAEGLRRILALYARYPGHAFYSVEVGRQIAVTRDRAYDLLGQLERRGVMCSHHEPAPLSGHGRRYFRLTDPHIPVPPTHH